MNDVCLICEMLEKKEIEFIKWCSNETQHELLNQTDCLTKAFATAISFFIATTIASYIFYVVAI